MFHQRNILRVYYLLAALVIFGLGMAMGSMIVSFLIVAVVSLPVIFVIKKLFPAPDWYANEDEGSGMTSMNLSSAATDVDKDASSS